MLKKVLGMLALSLLWLTGCGGSSETGSEAENNTVGAMESYEVGDTFRATEPVDFSLLFRELPSNPFNENWMFLEKLKEITNVSLDVTPVTLADFEQRRTVLISAGEAPDIMPIIWPGQETPFIPSGALLPVSKYLDYMPHFNYFVEKWGLEDEINNLRQDDGEFYILPGLNESPSPGFTLAIRTDILEEHGIPFPDSWDDIYEVLSALKEIYPDVYPWSDRWDMNASLGFASVPFGTTAGWSIGNGTVYDREKDEFVFSPATDNFKDLVTYFHTLIDEGLLDPESLTQGDDAAIQKFVNGETFMISTGAAGINDYRTSMDEILGEENYKIALIPTPDGPTGVIGGTRVDVGTIISASTVKNENFIAMLQFIDWLYYSEEGREFAIWGVEGETFTRDDEGNRVLMDQYNNGEYNLNPIGTEDLVEDHGFINGVFTFTFGSSDDLFLSLLSDEIKEYWQTVTQTRTFAEPTPNVIFTVQEQEKMTLTEAAITDYIRQNKLEFILGQRDLNEYDDFVKELEELGSNTLLGLINEAYQRTKNK